MNFNIPVVFGCEITPTCYTFSAQFEEHFEYGKEITYKAKCLRVMHTNTATSHVNFGIIAIHPECGSIWGYRFCYQLARLSMAKLCDVH